MRLRRYSTGEFHETFATFTQDYLDFKFFAILVLILAAVEPLTLHAQTPQDKDADKKNPPAAKTPKKDQKKPEKKEEPKKEEKKGGMTADTFSGLKFRLIGPAVASGRVMSIAVNPKNKNEYYVGVASGGVWKTVNDGTTWTPVFDGEGSYSIGWVALDPNDSSVVWVGSGESNSQRSVSYGDGIYRSDDGGKSWQNLGLKKSEHIGRVVIDPRDSKVVYVAAEGPLWGPGGDRGLYKSDGRREELEGGADHQREHGRGGCGDRSVESGHSVCGGVPAAAACLHAD